MEPTSGYARIDELAAGKLFGDYMHAFPEASRDASIMLRTSVQVGIVDRYHEVLERALRVRRPVPDVEWHALLAQVSWPRPLPEWDRGPIGQWRLDWNPAATPDWPEEGIICVRHPGQQNSWLRKHGGLRGWLFDDSPTGGEPFPWRRSLIKVVAIAVCTAIVTLALPPPETFDFWIAMAALVVALIAAAL